MLVLLYFINIFFFWRLLDELFLDDDFIIDEYRLRCWHQNILNGNSIVSFIAIIDILLNLISHWTGWFFHLF